MLSGELRHPEAFASIVTRSERMLALFVFVEAVAQSLETVLIVGETGTGKELIAEAIHAASGRSGELVRVNVAGLDDTMFSDTLFGHTTGAFTGAVNQRKGIIAQAGEGTIFLDEIGDLSPASQVKLLRLLESGEYLTLGSDLPRTTRARFVVATSRDLRALVSEGVFRKDLYYRLQTHEVRIPALRDRREDLMDLVEHFQREASESMGKEKLAVPAELERLLGAYDFPGNVRELRSMVYKAVAVQKSRMLPLSPFREAMGMGAASEGPPGESGAIQFPDRLPTIRDATEQLIDEALRRSANNQSVAAGLLGISPQALSRRLRNRPRDGSSEPDTD
jgi:DNA-binding NtrC family response regulator